jgi:hypothetical protein
MTNLIRILLALYVVPVLVACSQGTAENKQFDEVAFSDSVQKKVVHELGAVRLNIEQNAKFHASLSSQGVSFREELLTNPEIRGETSYEEALAFGAYAADFVYCVSYNQTQYAIQYLDIIIDLSRRLGLENAFDKDELSQLYSENPSVNKSAILTKAYLKASEQLYSEERAVLVTHMVVGGWVRGLSLAVDFSQGQEAFDLVRLGIYDKCYSYNTCKRLTDAIAYHPEIPVLRGHISRAEPIIEKVLLSRGEMDKAMLQELRDVIKSIAADLKLTALT